MMNLDRTLDGMIPLVLGIAGLWSLTIAGSTGGARDANILFDSNVSTKNQETEEELWCEYRANPQIAKGKRIVLIAGDDEYRSEESMPMLGQILAKHHGFEVTVLFPINPETGLIQPSYQTNIPGMHRIEGADLVVLGLRFRNLPDDQMKFFDDYVQSGKPLIGFRTSTHAFSYPGSSDSPYKHYSFNNRSEKWPDGFGKEFLGETWVNHHGKHGSESTRGVIVPERDSHPILQGVGDVWGDTDVYGIRKLPDDAAVLMLGEIVAGMRPDDPAATDERNQPMMPIAWIREYPRESGPPTRIFCTTMGSVTDFLNEGLRRMLINACYWCLNLEYQIDAESSVAIVVPFEATPFGFGTERNDLKPANFRMPD
jgi:hypothetical protein